MEVFSTIYLGTRGKGTKERKKNKLGEKQGGR